MSRIYIATQLYNIHDRLTSLSLCNNINGWIDTGILPDLEHCFLPYRDSNGQIPSDAPDLGQAIFDIDIKNVKASLGIACYIDGPTYDSGMGIELGFAYSLGLPLFLMTTDYFHQSVNDSKKFYSISKFVEHVATNVIHITENTRPINDYENACLEIRYQALEQLQAAMLDRIGQPNVPLKKLKEKYDFYIDPNFKYTEGGRCILDSITAALSNAGKSYVIGDNQGDIAADLKKLRSSSQVIFYADNFDYDIDSTIMQGISYGLGIDVILYSSGEKRYQNGDFIFHKNPMNLYSAKAVAKNTAELVALITA